jgi:hypothetical protein
MVVAGGWRNASLSLARGMVDKGRQWGELPWSRDRRLSEGVRGSPTLHDIS